MKICKISLIMLVAFSATSLMAQDIAGTWKFDMPMPDGSNVPVKAVVSENTYEFDFGMDGTVETTGDYTVEGDVITISNRTGDGECPPEAEGKYSFVVEGESMTITFVNDDCGGGPDQPITWTKM